MTSDGEDERAFVFQKLAIGYFLLGFAPAFVIIDPQGPSLRLLLTVVIGLITGVVALLGFQLVGQRLMDAIAGIDVAEAEPTSLTTYSTYLVVGLSGLAFLPVILWVMTAVAGPGEMGGGGRRSPLVAAFIVSAALLSVVAEPVWYRLLQVASIDVVDRSPEAQ